MSTEVQKIIDQMRELVTGDGPRPIPAALHIGEVAFDLLQATTERPKIGGLSALYGVPVVVGSLNSAIPLDERGWRILDRDGGVLAEGILE